MTIDDSLDTYALNRKKRKDYFQNRRVKQRGKGFPSEVPVRGYPLGNITNVAQDEGSAYKKTETNSLQSRFDIGSSSTPPTSLRFLNGSPAMTNTKKFLSAQSSKPWSCITNEGSGTITSSFNELGSPQIPVTSAAVYYGTQTQPSQMSSSIQPIDTSMKHNDQLPRGKQKENIEFHPNNRQTTVPRPTTKHRSKRISKGDIPHFVLDTNEEPLVAAVTKGRPISREYIDHGDALYVCSNCQALLWEAEMLRGNSDRKKFSFSLCCGNGKVQLPHASPPPPLLYNLYKGRNAQSKNFMNNIRAYNMMFSFTSMGGMVYKSVENGRGPYCFRLQGQNFHRIGSLLPEDGAQPKFSQLYIYDSENELLNRLNALRCGHQTSITKRNELDGDTIICIKIMLDSCNPLVKSFRMVRDCLDENQLENVSLKLISLREKDGRTYNLPTAPEVAALIVGDIDELVEKRDIVLRTRGGSLQRISELHPSYLALQYPLIFPYAEDGFRVGIKHRGILQDSDVPRTRLTMREFFCFRIQDRSKHFSLLMHAKKLLH